MLLDGIEGGPELALRQTPARSSRRPTVGDEVPDEMDVQEVAERCGAEPTPGSSRSRGKSRCSFDQARSVDSRLRERSVGDRVRVWFRRALTNKPRSKAVITTRSMSSEIEKRMRGTVVLAESDGSLLLADRREDQVRFSRSAPSRPGWCGRFLAWTASFLGQGETPRLWVAILSRRDHSQGWADLERSIPRRSTRHPIRR
jgi:hypothetical protein